MLRRLCVLIALILVGAACSSSLSREDAIQDVVDEGFGRSSAECMVDDLEAAGYSSNDLAADNPSTELRAAMADAVTNCASSTDVANVLDDVDPDEVRQQLMDSFVAGGLVDEEQAACILDQIEARGLSFTDVVQATLDRDIADVEATIADATVACLGG